MPSLVEFLILALATWRLGSLVQYERGPKAIFTKLRERFGITHGDDGTPIAWPNTEIAKLLECVWCGSVWVGLGMVGLYSWSPRLAVCLAFPFALSAVSIGLGVMINGKS
jgi:hypothetical protein